MEKAKVYFTDLHTSTRLPLVEKMKAVAKAAGIEKIDFKDKFVAIKMHFGEPAGQPGLPPAQLRRRHGRPGTFPRRKALSD